MRFPYQSLFGSAPRHTAYGKVTQVTSVRTSGIGSRRSITGFLVLLMLGTCPVLFAQESTPETAADATPAAEAPAAEAPAAEAPADDPLPADSESSASETREGDAPQAGDATSNQPIGEARGEDVTPDEAARILLDELDRPNEEMLRFNFTGASWKDVLDWLATEGDLSLQIDRYPTGSISFVDRTRLYSVSEALDLLNRLLLDRGYALVRRGRMLFLVDLEVENADKLISELAELVMPEDLEYRSKSDIVTSVFPLGSMTPDEAKEQLPQLVGPWGRVVVLDSARQAKVTERAEKLLAIREVIQQSAQQVHEIKLQYRGAEELLQTARPLLGLEAGENSNDDIRISIGLYGDRIYATGLPSKISILENLVSKADQPLESSGDTDETEVVRPIFQSHNVRVADPATVFEVLQTLLQDEPGTRVAIDPSTNAIIALATPTVHQQIDEVINKMEGSGENFEVFQLKRIDPAQALLTINKYFGVTEENPTGPIVDGDPNTGKLWVRGSSDEITQIKRLLDELDGSSATGVLSGKVRTLPISGKQADDVLRQLQLFWRMTGRENAIRVVTPGGEMQNNGIRERRIYREPSRGETESEPESVPTGAGDLDASRYQPRKDYYLTQAPVPTAAEAEATTDPTAATAASRDILIQVTPGGLRIASDDTEALDELEDLLSQLAGPSTTQDELPTIFWLKYIKADVAADLIASVLGGIESGGSLTDTLTEGFGGGMLGGLMGLAGGGGGGDSSSAKSILTTTGSVNIVPDLRLNALFVQANAIDLQLIEMVLEKIDREESPENIELTSTPRMIPVLHQDAAAVAKVVKEVFADRMAQAEQNQGGGGRGGQPSPQEFIAALRGGGRGGRGGGGNDGAKSERTKITVSVDTQSNSLVVSAPPQDFEDIRLLVEALDEGGKVNEVTTMVVPIPGTVNANSMFQALEAVLGKKAETKSDSSSNSNSEDRGRGSGNENASDAADEFRRRIEAFRAMRGGGGPPGGGDGPPGGFGGGRPGGFGGFPGGGRGGQRGGGRGR
ncbi:general secretion pathway protein [Roseiconus nitratireducens]|uniref:General secretion pathway protein n=1 Tax=Roseiconus nitratireducens TaxID=2605748 RepID=A0A5M6D9L4_9BACT|nr:secretin N-terminal domain-containing protein [Roseiconus nitratireducens]KAA5543120.1 general secretion pathway protein [Roseiconus nitratireducens]